MTELKGATKTGNNMKTDTVIDLITSIVPYTGTAGVLIKEWRDKKLREAQEIILSEIREGTFDNIDNDDKISIIHRLWRAISEGTAKKNFRLICRLVQGLGDNRQLTAPTFLRFASILDSLSDDEIKVIAYDIWQHKNPKPQDVQCCWSERISDEEIKQTQQRQQNNLDNWNADRQSFLSDTNYNITDDETIHYSLLRTGLYSLDIIPEAYIEHREEYKGPSESWNLVDAGSIRNFTFTENMADLMKYVDFNINHQAPQNAL